MNRSKGAAVMMLAGALAAGAGLSYAGTTYFAARQTRQQDCPQPRSENNFRMRFYADLGLDSLQRDKYDSLIDERNRKVNELYATPRAKSDSAFAAARAVSDSLMSGLRAKAESIRTNIREQQNALLTPAQRAKLAERQAAMRQRQDERDAERKAQQARCEKLQPKQASAPGNIPTSKSKPNNH